MRRRGFFKKFDARKTAFLMCTRLLYTPLPRTLYKLQANKSKGAFQYTSKHPTSVCSSLWLLWYCTHVHNIATFLLQSKHKKFQSSNKWNKRQHPNPSVIRFCRIWTPAQTMLQAKCMHTKITCLPWLPVCWKYWLDCGHTFQFQHIACTLIYYCEQHCASESLNRCWNEHRDVHKQ